jgi:lipopolysaccharide export system permease protein
MVSFLLVLGVFFAILYLVEIVEEVRRLASRDLGLATAARLALLNVPGALYRILPLVVILATVALFLSLARSSELVVARAAGRSALRMLVAPVVTALAIGIVAVAVFNPIVAGTGKQYEALSNRFQLGDASVLSIGDADLWLRQGGQDGQTVIRAQRANLDGSQLFNVTFIAFTPASGPVRRIEAKSAQLTDGAWVLLDAKEWPLETGVNAERDARVLAELSVPSDLTPDRIRDGFGTPSAVPIWELPAFIHSLERAGFSSRRHAVWFQMELALPLLLVAMVLIGAGFTMRHTRFGRSGMMVLLAMGLGFAIFFLRNFAQVLGETGQIPILLAAWSPPVTGVLLSLGLLLHLEDG